MPEESTTSDLVELMGRTFEAANRRDLDAVMRFHASDAIWDASDMGMGTFDGADAIHRLFVDWFSNYEEWRGSPEELSDLGNGVAFAVVRQDARPVGSRGSLQERFAYVWEFVDGLTVRVTVYTDIDEARAAAERLAEERG
jgi:ketosteroid isomerase-like protein